MSRKVGNMKQTRNVKKITKNLELSGKYGYYSNNYIEKG